MPAAPIKLILHVGAGKTGTSSIQHALRRQRKELAAQGFLYLGMMLEFSPVQLYEWQRSQSMSLRPKNQQLKLEVAEVLRATLTAARDAGIHTLVWSNEQLFPRARLLHPVLAQLVKRGEIELKVVAYVRRHDAWARSAYTQWGIKHKTYDGPLQSFAQWVESHPPRFMPALQGWLETVPDAVCVRNFDACDDVVQDFSNFCDLPGIVADASTRSNEALGPEATYLRAMFNACHETPMSVRAFSDALGDTLDTPRTPDQELGALLPTPNALRHLCEAARQDQEAVNALLARQGQPPLPTTPLRNKEMQVDSHKLLNALCQIVMRQSIRIAALETQLGQVGKLAPVLAKVESAANPSRKENHPAGRSLGISPNASRHQ